MKKILSLILSVIISFVFISNNFMIKAKAAFLVDDAITAGILSIVFSVIAGSAEKLTEYAIEKGPAYEQNINQLYLEKINQAAASGNELVGIQDDGYGNYTFIPTAETGSDTYEFSSYLANYLNNSESAATYFQTIYNGNSSLSPNGAQFTIASTTYANLKNDALNAFCSYINSKDVFAAASDMATSPEMTVIPFDFVGPLNNYGTVIPSTSGTVSLNLDGYMLSAPLAVPPDGYYFPNEAAAKAAGATTVRKIAENKYTGVVNFDSVYGYGYYVTYNGKIYYRSDYSGVFSSARAATVQLGVGAISNFVSADGERLGDTYPDLTNSSPGVHCGIYVINSPDQKNVRPTIDIPAASFTVSDASGDLSLDWDPDEKAVKDAIAKSLVSSDPLLGIDSAGNIVAADSVSIADLLDAITDSANYDVTADKSFDIHPIPTITDKFPFCLPFDIYKIFNVLSAEPKAPKFTIPIKMENINGTGYGFDFSIDVDLSEYSWIAEIVRWMLLIIFVLGLILVTNKLIGRG